ncbi:Hsp20/alpha crystallin family protein [Haloarchaeobius sp. HRN-SO-5]|uniref:Hsp20/alpha crystallin family protein n=1 Tax=Haloarchaeobius sp. HRN-SO-5 TaxID=3446118 RepID=UPI003EBA8B64
MSSRRNPFEELERLFDRMGRQFEEASRSWETDYPFDWWSSDFESMAIDLVEHDDEFVVTVDLPGFERDDVDIEVTNHTLRIEAEREEATEEVEEERYLRHERSHEATHRSIRLPDEVDADNVTATMNNGVLTIALPRVESEESRKIDIE